MVNNTPEDTWTATFRGILKKQPGRQWTNTRTPDPFGTGRNTLDEIMLKLLERGKANSALQKKVPDIWKAPQLPGSAMDAREEEFFSCLRHRRLLLELLSRWEKEFRSREVQN